MAPNIVSLVARAQRTSLLGVHDIEERYLPYESLGEDKRPYDLNDPTALLQLKAALAALGAYWSDRLARPDPSIEVRWSLINPSTAAWEPAAADELAFAIGRLRGMGWQVSGPYAVETPVGPQPTATGLELIAGAVNGLLGGSPRMTHYESWRGGVFEPPSLVSGPSPADPVTPCRSYGSSFKMPPAVVEGGVASGLQLARQALTSLWSDAMESGKDEAYRADIERRIVEMRSQRDTLVEVALVNAPPEPIIPSGEEDCVKAGGTWDAAAAACALPTPAKPSAPATTNYAPWVFLGLAAAGVGYAVWKRQQMGGLRRARF